MTASVNARSQLSSINTQIKATAIILGIITLLAIAAIGTMVYLAFPLTAIAIVAVATGASLAIISTIALSVLAITSRPQASHYTPLTGMGTHDEDEYDSWEDSPVDLTAPLAAPINPKARIDQLDTLAKSLKHSPIAKKWVQDISTLAKNNPLSCVNTCNQGEWGLLFQQIVAQVQDPNFDGTFHFTNGIFSTLLNQLKA